MGAVQLPLQQCDLWGEERTEPKTSIHRSSQPKEQQRIASWESQRRPQTEAGLSTSPQPHFHQKVTCSLLGGKNHRAPQSAVRYTCYQSHLQGRRVRGSRHTACRGTARPTPALGGTRPGALGPALSVMQLARLSDRAKQEAENSVNKAGRS